MVEHQSKEHQGDDVQSKHQYQGLPNKAGEGGCADKEESGASPQLKN